MSYKSNDVIVSGLILTNVGTGKVGYQQPLAPGGLKIGEMVNADLDRYWTGVYCIEVSVNDAEEVFFQTQKELPSISNVAMTIVDENDNTIGAVSLTKQTNPTEFIGTATAGVYDYFANQRKEDLVKIFLQMS